MAGRSNTGLQISGYRFLVLRMEHALVRGDVRMLDDPLRAQSLSLTAGCVLAVIAIAACAVLAFLQPRGTIGDAPIVMVRDSGALYARVGDTVHPVLNLASARLLADSAAAPKLVSASALDDTPGAPMVGIPGAPHTIDSPLTHDESSWAVCDDAASTTVLVGTTEGLAASEKAMLVTVRGESAAATYLLFAGRRAKVDLRNHAVVRALKLEGIAPRPIARAVLDATPEVHEIAPPHIPDAGTAGPAALHGFPVGTVIRVPRAESAEFYVVLRAGVQRIGQVAADLIRFTSSRGSSSIATVEPSAIGTVPVVDDLPVAAFPDRAMIADDPVVCVRWRWSDESVDTGLAVGDALPGRAVKLAQADAEGPRVDNVVVDQGRSAYVRAAGVTGDGARTGALYYVSDVGVVFGVGNEDAARRLGLPPNPVPAPWPVLARLPRGPELSVEAASVVRDSAGPP
jgi:type VII secretion protein EccB